MSYIPHLTGAPGGMSIEGDVLRGGTSYEEDSNALSFFQRFYLVSAGQGLVGCQSPYSSEAQRMLFTVAQRCLPDGLDGWLRFDAMALLVNFPSGGALRPATFDDLYVNIQGCDVHMGALSGVSPGRGLDCSTDIAYGSIRGPMTTVPEPASLGLLATGLLGLAPLARRRRR